MQAEGGNRGENGRRNDIRHRQMARVIDTIGGRWQVAGVRDVQVEGVLCHERRWRAGVTERCCDKNWLVMGVVMKEEGTNKDT